MYDPEFPCRLFLLHKIISGVNYISASIGDLIYITRKKVDIGEGISFIEINDILFYIESCGLSQANYIPLYIA